VLEAYIENDKSAPEIISEGFEAGLVHRVIEMVDRNEYKRRQAPPGIRITPKAFGKDRRIPITNKFRLH
jgi:NAD+ synthase (glutamine-hydrolysing)